MTSRSKPQWGNAAWKAAMVQHEWKPGRPGLRVCSATKRDGAPCGKLAMRGTHVCQFHGGRQSVFYRKLREAKLAKAPNQGRQLGRQFKAGARHTS